MKNRAKIILSAGLLAMQLFGNASAGDIKDLFYGRLGKAHVISIPSPLRKQIVNDESIRGQFLNGGTPLLIVNDLEYKGYAATIDFRDCYFDTCIKKSDMFEKGARYIIGKAYLKLMPSSGTYRLPYPSIEMYYAGFLMEDDRILYLSSESDGNKKAWDIYGRLRDGAIESLESYIKNFAEAQSKKYGCKSCEPSGFLSKYKLSTDCTKSKFRIRCDYMSKHDEYNKITIPVRFIDAEAIYDDARNRWGLNKIIENRYEEQ